MLLSEHSNQEIDVLKTMFMVLIHDAVEVDAGDTYAYDETGNLSKREREVKAAERIFNILPEEQGKKVRALWDEFEEKETPESKFQWTSHGSLGIFIFCIVFMWIYINSRNIKR